jgi:hypothetical protein
MGHVHAEHARQADQRTAWASNLRAVWRYQLMQLPPRRRCVDLSEDAVAARQLLLGSVLKVGKTRCGIDGDASASIVAGLATNGNVRARINQCFPKDGT